MMLGHKEQKLCPSRDSLWRLALASEKTLTRGYALGTPNDKRVSTERPWWGQLQSHPAQGLKAT